MICPICKGAKVVTRPGFQHKPVERSCSSCRGRGEIRDEAFDNGRREGLSVGVRGEREAIVVFLREIGLHGAAHRIERCEHFTVAIRLAREKGAEADPYRVALLRILRESSDGEAMEIAAAALGVSADRTKPA